MEHVVWMMILVFSTGIVETDLQYKTLETCQEALKTLSPSMKEWSSNYRGDAAIVCIPRNQDWNGR